MNNLKRTALLAAMLLIAFSQGFAQKETNDFSREIVLGANTGGGNFTPRILYKKVKDRRVSRTSLQFNTSLSNLNLPLRDSCHTENRQIYRQFNISLGFGFEKRKPLDDKFDFYHGVEFRPGYAQSSTNQVERQEACASFSEYSENAKTTHTISLGAYVFIGLRYELLPRLSFAVEAGPQIGGELILNKDKFYQKTQTPNAPELESSTSTNSLNTKLFASMFNRPFLSIAYHF